LKVCVRLRESSGVVHPSASLWRVRCARSFSVVFAARADDAKMPVIAQGYRLCCDFSVAA
jgi:hypothetical protein